jgi:plastocyanin
MKSHLLLILVVLSGLNAAVAFAASPDAAGSNISGKVRLEGTPPLATRLQMVSDPACAKAHTSPAMSEDVVTGSDGGLQNVVVYVSDGLTEQNFPAPTQPAVLEQKGCLYKPHVVALQSGQTLKVMNDDQTTHNIHLMPTNNREWNKSQPPGMTIEESIARQEVSIPVKCNIHPWMKSYVAVFKHPFFAVTGSDGAFDLKNLPPGTYTVQAWHEKLGTSTQKVTVGAGETKNVEFVFKSRM